MGDYFTSAPSSIRVHIEGAAEAIEALKQLEYNARRRVVSAATRASNAVLVKAFEAIYEYHRFSSIFTSQHEGEEQLALDTHVRLLEAMEKRDVQTSRRIMTKHLDCLLRYSRNENNGHSEGKARK